MNMPEQIKNEMDVIGNIIDCLKYGSFNGSLCQSVAIGQMYLNGLHKNLKDAYEQAKEKPIESKAEPVVAEANKAS